MDRNMMDRRRRMVIGAITSKVRTSFIYCLAEFEKDFGYMWGKDCEELSQEQAENLKFFQELRKRILDNGNNQIRKIEKELGEVL
jgi:hypothetical protein